MTPASAPTLIVVLPDIVSVGWIHPPIAVSVAIVEWVPAIVGRGISTVIDGRISAAGVTVSRPVAVGARRDAATNAPAIKRQQGRDQNHWIRQAQELQLIQQVSRLSLQSMALHSPREFPTRQRTAYRKLLDSPPLVRHTKFNLNEQSFRWGSTFD